MLFDFSQKVYKEISRTGYNNKTKLIFWRVFQLFPRTLSPRLLQSQSLSATIPSKYPPLVLLQPPAHPLALGAFYADFLSAVHQKMSTHIFWTLFWFWGHLSLTRGLPIPGGSFCCNYATSDEHHHYWWPSHAEFADTGINGTGCNCLELQIFIAKTCLDLINVLIFW